MSGLDLSLLKNYSPGYLPNVLAPFGENLRNIRLGRKLKAVELAAMVNVQPSTLSQWEREPGLPAIPTVLKLAKALRCSVEELLSGIDAEYDELRRDLIRQTLEKGSTLPERGSVDVPASGGTDRALVERVEQLEQQLAETTEVANRLARLLEQSGVPKEGRSTTEPAPGVHRSDRKTG